MPACASATAGAASRYTTVATRTAATALTSCDAAASVVQPETSSSSDTVSRSATALYATAHATIGATSGSRPGACCAQRAGAP